MILYVPYNEAFTFKLSRDSLNCKLICVSMGDSVARTLGT